MNNLTEDQDDDKSCHAPPRKSAEPRSVVSLEQGRAGRSARRLGRAGGSTADALARIEASADMVRAIVRDEVGTLLAQVGELRRDLVAANDHVLDTFGAAQLLGVCTKTVMAWVKGRSLPAHKSGAEWRFLRSELVPWVQSRPAQSRRRRGVQDVR